MNECHGGGLFFKILARERETFSFILHQSRSESSPIFFSLSKGTPLSQKKKHPIDYTIYNGQKNNNQKKNKLKNSRIHVYIFIMVKEEENKVLVWPIFILSEIAKFNRFVSNQFRWTMNNNESEKNKSYVYFFLLSLKNWEQTKKQWTLKKNWMKFFLLKILYFMCPIVTRNKKTNQKQLRACFVFLFFIFVIQELNRENIKKFVVFIQN